MNPWEVLVWLSVLALTVAAGSIVAENVYWTWVRPWRARRRRARSRRKRGRR